MNVRSRMMVADARRRSVSVPTTEDRVTTTLPATPDAAPLARCVVRAALEHDRTSRCDDALLVISELVTNAVLHGSAGPTDRVGLDVRRQDGGLRIEVTDECRGMGVGPHFAAVDACGQESGWGLPIVAQLADRWGIEREPQRTRVWCELDDVSAPASVHGAPSMP